MLVSGEYQLVKAHELWVIIQPRRLSPLVFCFCLLSLWLGVWASGLVALQLPKPMLFIGGLMAGAQMVCCIVGIAVLARGYLTRTLVFDGVEEKLMRNGKALASFADLNSMELKPGKGILLFHRDGRRWWLKCRNKDEALMKMCRAIEQVLNFSFDDSKTFVASRALVGGGSQGQVF